jgi:predicted unusual protein kinase regulating ubiquinone biosynthesis (AarF/ABC1/UbiB family)
VLLSSTRDPHPGNIIVLPGGKLVMLDFGACGLATAQAGERRISWR